MHDQQHRSNTYPISVHRQGSAPPPSRYQLAHLIPLALYIMPSHRPLIPTPTLIAPAVLRRVPPRLPPSRWPAPPTPSPPRATGTPQQIAPRPAVAWFPPGLHVRCRRGPAVWRPPPGLHSTGLLWWPVALRRPGRIGLDTNYRWTPTHDWQRRRCLTKACSTQRPLAGLYWTIHRVRNQQLAYQVA